MSTNHPECGRVLLLNDELVAEVQALARLNETSSRLWHVSDLREGLQEILWAAITLLGGDKGNVQLLGDDGYLRIVAHEGFERDFLDVFREVSAEDHTACGRALGRGERVVIADVEADAQYAPFVSVARAAGYRAVQSTPMISRDGTRLGVISTHFGSPHAPSEQELRLLDLYVRQAADFIDRCEAERELRESERRLKSMSDIAPGTILWATDADGGCSFISRRWQSYTGQATQSALGSGWLESIHDDDRESTRRAFLAAHESRTGCCLDYRLRCADGSFRWVLAAGRPRYDDSGDFLGFAGSGVDIHERKLAENALRESQAMLAGQREAFRAAMDGRPLTECLDALVHTAVAHFHGEARAAFYTVDSAGEGALHHVTGMSAEYAHDVAGFEIGPGSIACGLALHRGEPVVTRDVEQDPAWQSWLWMARKHAYRACWSFPLRANGGPVLGTFALYFAEPREPAYGDLNLAATLAHGAAIVISRYNEVAERSRAEAALQDANSRKDEFLAVLGHELRNPLAPLSIATDLLQEAEQRPALIKTVRPMMRRQLDHLTRLVDDLLDVSRISRGHAELQRRPFDLRRAVEAAVEQSRPLIAARFHELDVQVGDTPLCVDGDFQRLTQVFNNLLSNAAKYSDPEGQITVHAGIEDGRAFVSVRDMGFGIPRGQKDLFEMFSQVAEHRSLIGGGGLGVGLALCRQLVEMHGGSIEATSEGLGAGSEFTVRLPVVAAAEDEEQAPGNAGGGAPSRGVLIVDDNADAADMLQAMLELQGHDAKAVYDGPSALEAVERFVPDVVLLDIGMPGMDGYEVARRIRAMPRGGHVVIAALTGWGQDEDRRRTAEAGFDEHLTKPVDPAVLEDLLTAGAR